MEKSKTKLYILCLQSSGGQILEMLHSAHYDFLLMHAMEKIRQPSKISYWTLFDNFGKYIDGNFPAYGSECLDR